MTVEAKTGTRTHELVDPETLYTRILGLERGDELKVELTRPVKDHLKMIDSLERTFFDARWADKLALKISYRDPMGGHVTHLTFRVIEF